MAEWAFKEKVYGFTAYGRTYNTQRTTDKDKVLKMTNVMGSSPPHYLTINTFLTFDMNSIDKMTLT